jgi:DNA processing protein
VSADDSSPPTPGRRPAADGTAAPGSAHASANPPGLPETESSAFAAALACLPGAGPATLAAILQSWAPEEAWQRVRRGSLVKPRPGSPAAAQLGRRLACDSRGSPASDPSWQEVAKGLDPPGWWRRYAAKEIRVTWVGQPAFPAALVDDPQPVGVLFWRGSLSHLQRPCVAIVGTRRATPDGRSVAFEMGRDLAAAGICVVSGLALGIDGAAHAGALSCLHDGVDADRAGGAGTGPGPPAGVAASGVDVPYPRRHSLLWERVAERGLMLSESPPGCPAVAWRFPARNRIIAALSRMVVVVESHRAGGSLITAEAAILRGIDVRAVPGPVRSPASAGTNQLLHDGPAPVRNAQDVLDGLGIFLPGPLASSPRPPNLGPGRAQVRGALDPVTQAVRDAVLWRPSSFNQVVERSRVSVSAAARALDWLEAAGWVEREQGWWVRRSPDRPP